MQVDLVFLYMLLYKEEFSCKLSKKNHIFFSFVYLYAIISNYCFLEFVICSCNSYEGVEDLLYTFFVCCNSSILLGCFWYAVILSRYLRFIVNIKWLFLSVEKQRNTLSGSNRLTQPLNLYFCY